MKRIALGIIAVVYLLALPCTSRAQAGPDAFLITPGTASTSTLTGAYQTSRNHPNVLPTDMSPAPCDGQNNPDCSIQTGWNEPCPQGLNCGGGTVYCPQVGCGSIELTAQATVSGMIIPQYLGFPNNGFLPGDCTLTYGAPQFNQRSDGTMSDGSKLGDTWSFSGATGSSCTGYAQGVTYSVVTNWAVISIKTTLTRIGYVTTYTYQLSGGSGTAAYTPPS